MIDDKGNLYFIDFDVIKPIGSEDSVEGTYRYNSIEKSIIHYINVFQNTKTDFIKGDIRFFTKD